MLVMRCIRSAPPVPGVRGLRRPSACGYSLVEVVTVLAIIGILVAIVGPPLMRRATDAANLARMRSDLRELVRAQEIYYAESFRRPDGPRYASSVEELDFQPSPDVRITLDGGATGWTAVAEDVDSQRQFCSVFAGRIQPFSPASQAEVVACEPNREPRPREIDPRDLRSPAGQRRPPSKGETQDVRKFQGGGTKPIDQ